MHKLLLIVKREFLTKVKSKAYLVLIFLSPLLMIGMFSAIFYFANKDKEVEGNPTILSVTTSELEKKIQQELPNISIQKNLQISLEQAQKLVDDEVYTGLVYTSKGEQSHMIYGSEETPFKVLQNVLLTQYILETLQKLKIDEEIIETIISKKQVQIVKSNASKNGIRKWTQVTIAVGLGYLVMMFVIIYGNSVMRSIIEEKNSRVIEIMICTVKPFQLMLGKIIGNALAGVLQFVIWGVLLLVGLALLQTSFSVEASDATQISQAFTTLWELNFIEISICFVLFFMSGYLLYSGFYASVGAAVNSETDTQQFVHPILLPLMFAVYIGMITVINGNPHGSTATLFSMIPFTSPIVMLMRIPFGVPLWQIILSLALLLVSFTTTVFVASKIYRIGILTYGNKPNIKQLVKWMFYK